jgi:hypothetical protein
VNRKRTDRQPFPSRPACAVLFLFISAIAAPLFLTSRGSAETVRHGSTTVHFRATLSPRRLPRDRLAPISLRLAVAVQSDSDTLPPQTRLIRIATNRNGRFDRAGLPICNPRRLHGTSSAQALLACGDALVGRGTFLLKTRYPEAPVAATPGTVLAFNARGRRGPEIVAHLYSTLPATTSHLLVFHLHRQATGPLGTVISARLAPSLDPYGSLLALHLVLHRTYAYRGALHSFLSASCPAPPGFSGGIFPLARAFLAFADRSTLTATATASCWVRRRG